MIGQPYRHLVVVTLGAIVWSACGQDAPARSTGVKSETAPAPPPISSTQAPQESRPAADVKVGLVDPDAEYDKGAALAAARQRLAAIE